MTENNNRNNNFLLNEGILVPIQNQDSNGELHFSGPPQKKLSRADLEEVATRLIHEGNGVLTEAQTASRLYLEEIRIRFEDVQRRFDDFYNAYLAPKSFSFRTVNNSSSFKSNEASSSFIKKKNITDVALGFFGKPVIKTNLKAEFLDTRTELARAYPDLLIKSQRVEKRKLRHGSICGIFNPLTGEVEWKQRSNGGCFGVWNPLKERIEWRQNINRAVCGVWNPDMEQIEWKDRFGGGICGVWHPIKRKIYWNTTTRGGICGVWNPYSEEIEWRTEKDAGVCGYFSPSYGGVEWIVEPDSGVCCVIKNPEGNGYITSCSNLPRATGFVGRMDLSDDTEN
eukprot:augustus_masked-scaffold_7-processed-gene-10.3-mRNA-1 protein AED:1.00 eAED:1.00 QI:0/-1/0/0/-1/1/1/0/339